MVTLESQSVVHLIVFHQWIHQKFFLVKKLGLTNTFSPFIYFLCKFTMPVTWVGGMFKISNFEMFWFKLLQLVKISANIFPHNSVRTPDFGIHPKQNKFRINSVSLNAILYRTQPWSYHWLYQSLIAINEINKCRNFRHFKVAKVFKL